MVVDMGDFLFQLVITHLPGRKKGGVDGFVCG